MRFGSRRIGLSPRWLNWFDFHMICCFSFVARGRHVEEIEVVYNFRRRLVQQLLARYGPRRRLIIGGYVELVIGCRRLLLTRARSIERVLGPRGCSRLLRRTGGSPHLLARTFRRRRVVAEYLRVAEACRSPVGHELLAPLGAGED